MSGREEIEKKIIEVLRGRELTFEELVKEVGWEGDRRGLRSVLADMVRRGVVGKKPDYDKRRLLFYLKGEG